MSIRLNDPEDRMENVSATGMPVSERVKTAQAARTVYDDMVEADYLPAQRRARLQGLANGNPPYDPRRLEELGMGYMTNVNFGECSAILDQKASAFYELFFEVPTLIQVRMSLPADDVEGADQWGPIIEEEFTTLLMDWSGFLIAMDKSRRESDKFGLGVMFWRDEYDWRPKAFNCGSFRYPAHAGLDIEELDVFALDDQVSVGQLYKWALEDQEVAKEQGWNPAQVKKMLVSIYRDGESQSSITDITSTSEWESLEQRIKNGDALIQQKEFQPVRIIHLLVKEYDTDEVSHYIIPDDEYQHDAEEEFLFRHPRRFVSMSRVLWWLPYNNGDDYLRSVRGLASRIEHYCDLSNRFLGRVFDAGFITSSLLIQPSNAGDMSQMQMIRMGVMTIVPPGTDVIQSSFQPQIQPLIQLRDMSGSVMRNNTGVWKQHAESATAVRQPDKTARQVAEEVAKEARIEKSGVTYDYYHIERLYREIFRRVTDPDYLESEAALPGRAQADKFIRRCVQRGVPYEVLVAPDVFQIYATRAIGMGSLGAKMDITNQVLETRFLYDEQGQINATRDWLAVRVGYQNVDRYKPPRNRDDIPSNVHSMVALENNDIQEGQPVVVGADQMHVIHLNGHLPPLVEIMKAVMETEGVGIDAQRVLPVMQVGGQHVQEHLQYVAQDPAREQYVNTITEFLKQFSQAIELLARQAEQQAAEAEKQRQADQQKVEQAEQAINDRDFLLKMREIELKQESMHRMRVAKTEVQNEIRRQDAEAGIALKSDRQQAELNMDAEKVRAEIEIDKIKARSSGRARGGGGEG
jgi:hypothetical protein